MKAHNIVISEIFSYVYLLKILIASSPTTKITLLLALLDQYLIYLTSYNDFAGGTSREAGKKIIRTVVCEKSTRP